MNGLATGYFLATKSIIRAVNDDRRLRPASGKQPTYPSRIDCAATHLAQWPKMFQD